VSRYIIGALTANRLRKMGKSKKKALRLKKAKAKKEKENMPKVQAKVRGRYTYKI